MPFQSSRETISVVVPVRNSPGLPELLSALACQTVGGRMIEVIVAGQQQSGLPPCTFPVRFLAVADPTPANNRNQGAFQAQGDWVAFTDADCLPAPDWLEKLLENPTASALAGSVAIPEGMPYWGWCDHLVGFELQALGLARPGPAPYAATLNFAVRRDLFTSLGGFDLRYTAAGGEDREFCERLVYAGHVLQLIPAAVVVHNHVRSDFASAWRHIAYYGRVTAQFRYHHYEQTTSRWRLAARLARLPVVGELLALGWAATRFGMHLVRRPSLWQYARWLPGMAVLNAAFTYGMIAGLRVYAP